MVDYLKGILATVTGDFIIGGTNSVSTDSDDTTSCGYLITATDGSGTIIWDMNEIHNIILIRFIAVIVGVFSNTQVKLEYSVNGTSWTGIFNYTDGLIHYPYIELSVNNPMRYLKITASTTGTPNVTVVVDSIEAFTSKISSVTMDTSDEYSLPEHNSWGVQAGLPLPKGLRAWK